MPNAKVLSEKQAIVAGLTEKHHLVERHDLAVHEAALDFKVALQLLGEVVDHAGGGDGVVLTNLLF